jgi:aminomethyltransferase
MKRTALYDKHLDAGAKMVPFAGFEMPVQYTGVNDEHRTVRSACGVFDVSHMGEFFVRGKDALPFLQRVTSNDVAKLFPGKVQYSCFPNGNGGIVDDLLVYCFSDSEFMLVVNASNIEKDWSWLQQHAGEFEVEMENASDRWSLLAVQGPQATTILQDLTDVPLSEMKYYTFARGAVAGVDDLIISATGYTGAGGFELYVPNDRAGQLWDAVLSAGEPIGLKPAGLAARDTLRLEMGFCLYGNDIDDSTSPIEAGLGWITKFTKDFIDADRLKRQKEEGTERRLVGFEMIDKGIPRMGYELLSEGGEAIGRVTSGTMSPSLGKSIGMGYVKTPYREPGTKLLVKVRNKELKAEVVKFPFYKNA